MKKKALIIYHSRFGQTQKIVSKMQAALSASCDIQLVNIDQLTMSDMQSLLTDTLDFLIIGAPIYYGHHAKRITQFIQTNHLQLQNIPCAFFSVNLTARKPDKATPENNPYLIRFLQKTKFNPTLTAVFAGKLQYPSYNFLDKFMIQLIMRMTHGVTDTNQIVEYTNWKAVASFCEMITTQIIEKKND